jgi:hypothetical protein
LRRRLLILIAVAVAAAVGAAAAQYLASMVVRVRVAYPTHTGMTLDLGVVAAGSNVQGGWNSHLMLPAAYTVTWSLGGDLGDFEEARVLIHVYRGWPHEPTAPLLAERWLTLSARSASLTLEAGDYTVAYSLSVTPRATMRVGAEVVAEDKRLEVVVGASRP